VSEAASVQVAPTVRVGIIQMSMSERREENLSKAGAFVADAVREGAALVILPELFVDRYFPQRMDPARYALAEPVPGGLSDAIGAIARRHGVALVGGVYERAAEGLLYNTALAFAPDGTLVGHYRKVHIPHGPGYEEKYYFAPGDLGFQMVKMADVPTGLAICWDQWFPETGRALALAGAELVVFPTAIGSEPNEPGFSSLEAWRLACRAQALFNQVFVAAVNRTGAEELLTFYGGSFICDPWGRVLVEAGEHDEGAFVADCDLGQVRATRELFQFYRDRRPEVYGVIAGRPDAPT
jgi:N-carbamoylputrescine amidase